MPFLTSCTTLFKRYCRVSFAPVSHGVESKFRNYLSYEHMMEQVPHCVILIGLKYILLFGKKKVLVVK